MSIPAHIVSLLHSDEPSSRQDAIDMLKEIGGSEVSDILTEIMLSDSDKFVRQSALHALFTVEGERASDKFIRVLRNDPERRVRVSATRFLGELAMTDALLEALNDSGHTVRETAIEYLGEAGVLAPIIQMFRDTEGQVRQVAAETIGRHGDSSMITDLKKLMSDEDSYVREAAQNAIEALTKQTSHTTESPQKTDSAESLQSRPSEKLFRFRIEDVFNITGRGVVVTGIVQSGTCHVGQKVSLLKSGSVVREVTISSLETFASSLEVASAGDKIGIGLPMLNKQDVEPGMILESLTDVKPNMIPESSTEETVINEDIMKMTRTIGKITTAKQPVSVPEPGGELTSEPCPSCGAMKLRVQSERLRALPPLMPEEMIRVEMDCQQCHWSGSGDFPASQFNL